MKKKKTNTKVMKYGFRIAVGGLCALLCAVIVLIFLSVSEANDNFDAQNDENRNETVSSETEYASIIYSAAHLTTMPTGNLWTWPEIELTVTPEMTFTPTPEPTFTPEPTPEPTVTPEPTPVNLKYPYEIVLDKSKQVVTIYTVGEEGYYDLMVKQFICSTGKQDKIVDGMYRIQEQYDWRKMQNESYAQYASRISGPFLFHSCTYYEPKGNKLRASYYARLGRKASSGCVRLLCGDAYWIYTNCPIGTPIHVITSGEEDPELLEKLAPPELKGNWDPTDPNPKNPYRVTPAPDTTPDPTPALGVTPAPTPEWTVSPELKAWGK